MKPLTFSNVEVKKIVDLVSKGKKWSVDITSIDGKISWNIVNNAKDSKIDVNANGKYIDDYVYDVDEADDVYATILNVLDYLTNIVNKYNKRNPNPVTVSETRIEAHGVKGMNSSKWRKVFNSEKDMERWVDKNDAEVQGTRELDEKSIPEKTFFNIELSTDQFQEAISQGMLRAYSKRMKEEDVHYTCKACETNLPKYQGKYPTKCPKCGESITAMKENDKDEAIWGGPFKRGEVVSVSLEDPNEFYDATLITYNVADNTYCAELKDGGKVVQNIKREQIKI